MDDERDDDNERDERPRLDLRGLSDAVNDMRMASEQTTEACKIIADQFWTSYEFLINKGFRPKQAMLLLVEFGPRLMGRPDSE